MFLVNFIVARPLLSHGLLSFLDFLVLALMALHPALGAIGLYIAASIVSVFYYGREAGQREHDLKRLGWTPVKAWLGASFMVGWTRNNVAEFLVPLATTFAAAGTLHLLMSVSTS